MKVAVTGTINCAHQLPDTALHGHTYRVTATRVRDDIGTNGMVIPFDVLRNELSQVLARLDHRRLEDVIGKPATAERLAIWICEEIRLTCVTVRVEVGEDGWVETE